MTAFTVWKFNDPTGAERAVKALQNAASDGLVKIVDHAVVSWPENEERPRTEHGHDDPKRAAGWGALWGVLAGALFLVPIVGGVVGAGIGALSKATEGTGISKEDLTKIRTEVTPGTSALFIVTEEGDLDRLAERFRFTDVKLIHTNLTDAERSVLLDTFGGA